MTTVAGTPSPITGFRLALRLRRLVGAVWLALVASFLPVEVVVGLATRATRANLPAAPLAPGDEALILVELLRPVAAPLAVALGAGALFLLAWTVLWHAGVVRWWSVKCDTRLAEILGRGVVWWWRYGRLALVAAVVTAALLAAVWAPLAPLIRSAETIGGGGRSGLLLGVGVSLTLLVLLMCWLATLHGAWRLGEAGRRSALLAWLRGLGATLRRPFSSLLTLAAWAVPGLGLLVLPLLVEGSLAAAAFLPAWLGSAFCWVALFMSFAPQKSVAVREPSPLEPPTYATTRFPTRPPDAGDQ